ncbi:MAG: nitroreductase family protein [Elusimicrobiota bacterium]|jgi:nitroreductase|nr:nitroreductase family protein [Elusimicrobiota bacterium]
MQLLDAINKRRSIRQFTGQPITDEQLQTILNAAMMAPTGRNIQEWEFLVIKDKETLLKIIEVHPYTQMLTEAACAIIVCGNMQKDDAESFWIGDCGAASQNILLTATDLGLGSCWCGVQNSKERTDGIRKLFNLPSHIMPFNVIAIGRPAETRETPQRFDSEKVHYEKW